VCISWVIKCLISLMHDITMKFIVDVWELLKTKNCNVFDNSFLL